MLANRREFLKYIDKIMTKPINTNGPLTAEAWTKLIDRIKVGLPTCPIVCLNGYTFAQINLQIEANDKGDLPEFRKFLNELETNYKEQVSKLNNFVDNYKLQMLAEGSDDSIETIEAVYKTTFKKAESDKQKIVNLLDNILNNPIEYETRGMPFDMLMVLTTDYPKEPLLGLLVVELDPENWLIFEVAKEITNGIVSCQEKITALGMLCKANSGYIKTLDYLLCQRNSMIEVEPTSMGLGQHITGISKGVRQVPQHVIYIGTKRKFLKDFPNQAQRMLRKPVFAHMVRGHWRKLQGKQVQGKDRQGNPVFNGYTWVIAHKRGLGEITSNPVYKIKEDK